MVPLCRRCNFRHYNFADCVEAAKARRLPEVVNPRVPEGYRLWNQDRLSTWDRNGWLIRKDDDAPQEAA